MWRTTFYSIIALLGFNLALSGVTHAAPFMTEAEYDEVQIVQGETAPEPENLPSATFQNLVWRESTPEHDRVAAESFQKYWEQLTGFRPPIVGEADQGKINVYVGPSALGAERRAALELGSLGTDGVVIRTFEGGEEGPRALVLAGEGDWGTVYSVSEFLERWMGVRWLAPGVTHIPETPAAIEAIDYRYTPPFAWRENSFHQAFTKTEADRDYRRGHKFPSELQWMMWGGHNLYRYVPPEEYFETHPEYYALVNGERIAPVDLEWTDVMAVATEHPEKIGQLCMSNPEVIDIIAGEVKQELREHPKREIINVSPMDWGGHCECEACGAIDEREGSPAGSVLYAVNGIAEQVGEEFPEVKIQTFAYMHTQKPPRHMKARENVIVQFAPIGLDYSRPMTDPEIAENIQAARDMAGWAEATQTLQGWEYVTNFQNPNGPHPNLHVIQPNIQEYAKNGVNFLFAQGFGTSEPALTEFLWLRSYLVDKALWNPEEGGRAQLEEFVELYYGEAGPFILDYLDLMREHVYPQAVTVRCFNDQEWLRYDVVSEAARLFEQALTAAENEKIRDRVRREQVAVHYSTLVCPPKVEYGEDELTLVRPESITLEEYIELLGEFNAQARPYEGYFPVKYIRERCDDETPPRRETSALVKLANEAGELWMTPGLQGAIIRWRLMDGGEDLLAGYEGDGRFEGTFEEWNITNVTGTPEQAVADEWTVASQEDARIVLTTTLEDGLTLEKTIELRGDGALDYTLVMENPTTGTIAPNVKVHPEFDLAGATAPEFWVKREGEWTQINTVDAETQADGGLLAPLDFERWAVWIPERELGVMSIPTPAGLAGAFWFYNSLPGEEIANLELLPVREALEPGQRREVHAVYRPVRVHPAEGE